MNSFSILFRWGGVSVGILAQLAALALPPVLQAGKAGIRPEDEMRHYLLRETEAAVTKWKQAYEQRTDLDAIRDHYARLREKLVASLGGFPERTPLNPRITGVLKRDGYRVEKVIFESQPRFYVTGDLFLPDPRRHPPPWPGVLVPCGHYIEGKAHGSYQAMGALLALNGMAGFVVDPIEEGERMQSLDANGDFRDWGSASHTDDGIQSMLLGQDLARYFIWDNMRAIDYLQSRHDIDPTRIGCTGNSGGGVQTEYLLALDDRIGAAAPSCSVKNNLTEVRENLSDGEHYFFNELNMGLDDPDYLLMRAPTPVKVLAATHDHFDICSVWETFRYVQRGFTRLGFSERAEILENDAGHNYNRTQREATARWMSRWLLHRDVVIKEPKLKLFSPEELDCTPEGQVMLLPGARSIHDLFRQEADRVARKRRESWARLDAAQRRAVVRRVVGCRSLADLPPSTWKATWTHPGDGYRVEGFRVTTADGALIIPALWYEPDHPTDEPGCVFLFERGFGVEAGPDGPMATLARSGRRALAIDVRGTGETEQRHQKLKVPEALTARDYLDLYTAYMLGKSYVGMQTEDVLTAVREMIRRTGRPVTDMVAVGRVGVPALHAAFIDPAAFRHVTIDGTLASWDEVVRANRFARQFMNAVHGVLLSYDLPDLAAGLGGKLTILHPASARGPLPGPIGAMSPERLRSIRPGLIGLRFDGAGFKEPEGIEFWDGKDTRFVGLRGSERWKGFLTLNLGGEVEFEVGSKSKLSVEAADRVSLKLDGRTVAIGTGTSHHSEGTATIMAHRRMLMEVDFDKPRQKTKRSDQTTTVFVHWRTPGGVWKVLPSSGLTHTLQQEIDAQTELKR